MEVAELKPLQLEHFRKLLLNERRDLLQLIDDMRQTTTVALEDSISELSLYDNHPADIGSESFERSKDFALEEEARLRLRAVEDALTRVARGTYGICERCGRQIPLERLEAMPSTTLCIRCKTAEETMGPSRARPVEEEVLARPFVPSFDGSNEFDREDTWQDIAQHGLSTAVEDVAEEDRGTVQDIEAIPYVIEDGMVYEDVRPGARDPLDGTRD